MENECANWSELTTKERMQLMPFITERIAKEHDYDGAVIMNKWFKLYSYYNDKERYSSIVAKHPEQRFHRDTQQTATGYEETKNTKPAAEQGFSHYSRSKSNYGNKGAKAGDGNQVSLF